jgi:imidazolonepropionase-like amidohydrolase
MHIKIFRLFAVLLYGIFSFQLYAQVPPATPATPATLFQNVRVLNKTGQLSAPSNVLVRGNVIERISTSAIPSDPGGNTKIIAGGGRTLMPGLIDAHVHLMMASVPQAVALTADIGYLNIKAEIEARATLMRGFTTVRDLGGPAFGLKRAIDEGVTVGPRMYVSGAFISQTGGHGDFRMPYEIPKTPGGPLSHMEQVGAGAIADSPDEVRL